jgi:hypothetical protein
VTAKSEPKYTPESYKIRSVDVPHSLLDKLKMRQKSSQSLLVFPSAPHPTRKSYGGGVDSHMLETCKAVAFRAGLNCSHCRGAYTIKRSKTRKETLSYSCGTHPRCERWYLHKWRHTYAMPDAPAGGGITEPLSLYANDTFATSLSLTLAYSWLYGEYEFSKTPGLGNYRSHGHSAPRRFPRCFCFQSTQGWPICVRSCRMTTSDPVDLHKCGLSDAPSRPRALP